MARQPSLFAQANAQSSEQAPAQTSSLFFALFPDTDAAAQLFRFAQELRTQLGLTGKVIGAERLHVTLHWLGDYVGELPERILAQAHQAAATITSSPIDLTLDKARSFFGRSARPFVLGMREENAALSALHNQLGAALVAAGVGKLSKEAYTPHVTLLYDKKPIASQPITPVRWTARELVLVRSLVGKSQYERLHAWPFRP
jgi:RNA 2',3'-cyclic 3'-phosphodiesterase